MPAASLLTVLLLDLFLMALFAMVAYASAIGHLIIYTAIFGVLSLLALFGVTINLLAMRSKRRS